MKMILLSYLYPLEQKYDVSGIVEMGNCKLRVCSAINPYQCFINIIDGCLLTLIHVACLPMGVIETSRPALWVSLTIQNQP